MPSTKRRSAAANQSSTLSDQSRENSGSCSGHRMRRRRGDPVGRVGGLLGQRPGHRGRARPVPVDRPDERARAGRKRRRGGRAGRARGCSRGRTSASRSVRGRCGRRRGCRRAAARTAGAGGRTGTRTRAAGPGRGCGCPPRAPAARSPRRARGRAGPWRRPAPCASRRRSRRARPGPPTAASIERDHLRGLAVDAVGGRVGVRRGWWCRRSRAGRARARGGPSSRGTTAR